VTITAREARRALRSLIEQVNDDRAPLEITSKRGNAVLMSADDYAASHGGNLCSGQPVDHDRSDGGLSTSGEWRDR
jgi:prevent-host-death family protein